MKKLTSLALVATLCLACGACSDNGATPPANQPQEAELPQGEGRLLVSDFSETSITYVIENDTDALISYVGEPALSIKVDGAWQRTETLPHIVTAGSLRFIQPQTQSEPNTICFESSYGSVLSAGEYRLQIIDVTQNGQKLDVSFEFTIA